MDSPPFEGQLEKIRQSGLYPDTDAQLGVTSNPASVARIDAERWIRAATRVLNLLEKGVYCQPYYGADIPVPVVREPPLKGCYGPKADTR